MTVDRRTVVRLADARTAYERLSRIRPRDCVYVAYDVDDLGVANEVLPRLTAAQRLLAGVGAGPTLRAVSWDGAELVEFLRATFPPPPAVPVVGPEWLPAVREVALGLPGEPVAFGLFPATPTKLARLALARSGDYPAAAVRAAAYRAYRADRSKPAAGYHGHDAFACALVHPDVDATGLADRYGGHTSNQRGWRSRRKTHELIRWAA
ncbi:MAG TPA: hypothetical protein VGJ44_18155, partial [Kribbellaceae bacterium]